VCVCEHVGVLALPVEVPVEVPLIFRFSGENSSLPENMGANHISRPSPNKITPFRK